jgi:anaerobic magnesium-protoporphyrin IX monomethyl ester cyclase
VKEISFVNILLLEVNPYVPVSLPISLGYLAARLRADGHRVEIRNIGEATRLSPMSFQEMIREIRPALVGFATYQRNILHVTAMCRAIKALAPSIRIILGGPQIPFMPSEALREMADVDFLCRGEGEVVIREVVRSLEGGPLDRPVPGTTTRLATDHWADGPPAATPEDLDEYPSPFLTDGMDVRGMEEAIMLTSRGCPYGCAFCYTPRAFGRKIRYHSVDRVLEEMSWLNKRGIERFWLADPSFSFQRDRTEKLLRGIVARSVRGSLWLETRADLVDSDLLELMRAAGVKLVAYGLESASERVLEGLGKGLSLPRLREAVGLTLKCGMDVELFSQYGLPRERIEDAIRTLEFVRGCVPIRGNTNAQQMRLYFGTTLLERLQESGIRPLDAERPPYMSPGSRYETRWMTVEEIHRVRDLWKAASQDGGKRMVS